MTAPDSNAQPVADPKAYPRDLVGYGQDVPHALWPRGARIAVQFVLNYEEGAENNVLHGDPTSEQFLSEIVGAAAYEARHMSMESIYEYGSRAGVWRLLREFDKRGWPLTVFGVSMALQRHPELTKAFVKLGHEIACHGWRWIHYQHMDEAMERKHLHKGLQVIQELTGQMPLGWYTGRDSPNTRRLVVEHGGLEYDADYYGDDLPFWTEVQTSSGEVKPHLVVPYTLDTNDMRFATPQGFNTGDHFFDYLKDSFDVLYAEGDPKGLDRPKMLSVGMHCRLLGRPGRFRGLQKFLDYVQSHEQVWVCRRIDIARHWKQTHPFSRTPKFSISEVNTWTESELVRHLGAVFESSPWVAKNVASCRPFDSVAGLHSAMVAAIEAAGQQAQLELIRAHPELAGKAAIRGELTEESTREQAGAGLSLCSPQEFEVLHRLNSAYNAKFGFPFIVAVRGHTRHSIMTLFEQRLHNSPDAERQECLNQIYKIGRFRLDDLVADRH
ncbi:MAG: allantoinase PuuE [Betaproteobacteria bacterium]|nr:allantoinase PuuE [Betaproteobacteria bacterium]